MKFTLLPVNLQEGLILQDGRIVGMYSEQNRIVIPLAGKVDEKTLQQDLPDTLKDYQVLSRVSDCIALQCYTNSGWLNATAVKTRFSNT